MTDRDGVIVHYHEIGLKGRNRRLFERALMSNLARATADVGGGEVRRLPGRIVVDVPEAGDAARVARRAAAVYGVANAAHARATRYDFDRICEIAGEVMAVDHDSFAVRARVAHSDIAMSPREINEKLGAWLQERTGTRVDLSNPDRTCHVEVVGDRAFVYADRLAGAGGLPVGTGGVVTVLLSAGIDSPVAAARLMRRGARCTFVHFHSQPFTDGSSVRNVTELAGILTRGQYEVTLHLTPLAPAQETLAASCPEGLRTILYRRMMVRIAGMLAERDGAQALVTGDSLGQVASQTLENLRAVEDASPLAVLRPLIGLDKLEIIDQAERLGTFEASSAPCQEACVLFEPKKPATKARIQDLRHAERDVDVDGLVHAAVDATETRTMRFPDDVPANLR